MGRHPLTARQPLRAFLGVLLCLLLVPLAQVAWAVSGHSHGGDTCCCRAVCKTSAAKENSSTSCHGPSDHSLSGHNPTGHKPTGKSPIDHDRPCHGSQEAACRIGPTCDHDALSFAATAKIFLPSLEAQVRFETRESKLREILTLPIAEAFFPDIPHPPNSFMLTRWS